ncbi:hypothetical protein NX059_006860 [Plenodomus lindquistii]|nr:hypothetical protein NX059_006860 [Plenodomus lindquistii]
MLKNTAAGVSLQSHFEATKENGPTTSVVILGQTFVSTSDPQNIKTVLATKFKDFDLGERNDAFGPFLGSGIFAADGTHWEKSRALIRPSFTKAQVAELPTVEEHFQNLVSRIPADAATVDLQPLFFNFTLDSATHFLLGHSVGFQLSPAGSEAEKFSRAFDRAQEHLQTRALVGRFRALLKNRQFKEDCRFVQTFVDGYVTEMQQHRSPGQSIDKQHEQSEKSSRYNLMGELADATNDPTQLRSELLNILLAARDTTASLLSSTFFLLARHPSVWNRLESEIAQLNGRPPSYEDIRDMRYVRAVLHES